MRLHDNIIVKVCGVASEEDGRFASECGADIIGVILDPSVGRHGDHALITRLHRSGIKVAGVYTSLHPALTEYGDEDYIQLHFPHDGDTVRRAARETGKDIISVIQFSGTEGLELKAIEHYNCGAEIVLLENRNGIESSLDGIAGIQKAVRTGVAGRISPHNVSLIAATNPLMIDVSSSLELRPGKKDPIIVREFFRKLEVT